MNNRKDLLNLIDEKICEITNLYELGYMPDDDALPLLKTLFDIEKDVEDRDYTDPMSVIKRCPEIALDFELLYHPKNNDKLKELGKMLNLS